MMQTTCGLQLQSEVSKDRWSCFDGKRRCVHATGVYHFSFYTGGRELSVIL